MVKISNEQMLEKRTMCLFILALILQLKLMNGENCALRGRTQRRTSIKVNVARRQDKPTLVPGGPSGPGGLGGDMSDLVTVDRFAEMNKRYTTISKKQTRRRRGRSTASRISLAENCDYVAYYCMKVYDTGKICARTVNLTYASFDNYCMMDYTNCMEGYEVWQVTYMGECTWPMQLDQYEQYPYLDDYFMDQMYVLE